VLSRSIQSNRRFLFLSYDCRINTHKQVLAIFEEETVTEAMLETARFWLEADLLASSSFVFQLVSE
jgi:hypothetical protein